MKFQSRVHVMGEDPRDEVGRILDQLLGVEGGDRHAQDRLFELVYDELRKIADRLMRGERSGHTLRPTALVHEAYIRLAKHPPTHWKSKAHFLGVAARAMREILVEYARRRRTKKRGGGLRQVTLDEAIIGAAETTVDVLALDGALQALSSLDARMERIVVFRVFGGLNMDEIAELLHVSRRTAYNDWDFARHWLAAELAS